MRTFLATIAALALIGCLGSVDPIDPGPGGAIIPDPNAPLPGDVTPEEAQALFEANVAPIMEGKCAGAGGACHVGSQAYPPAFLGQGPVEDYYLAVTSDALVTGGFKVQSARLLLKLQISAHQNLTYSSDEVTLISEWLNAELAARNPGETPGAVAPAPAINVLAQWAGCMNLEDWNQTNMGSWASKGSDEGNCSACHVNGLARFNTNDNDTTMFEANRFEIFIGGFFAMQIDPVTGGGKVVPATDKLVYMGSGQPGNLHPRYNTNVENDNRFQRLQAFYDLTLARVEEEGNPRCGPAAFPVGTPPL